MVLVRPGQVLRREGAEEGEFAGKHSGGDDLGERPCMDPWWVTAPGAAEHGETHALGIDGGAAADRPHREGGEGD